MNIYYLKIDEISQDTLLEYSNNKCFASAKRKLEYCAGRFLISGVCRKLYNIDNPEIILDNKKPCLKNKKIEFSLSHSGGFVFAAFDNSPCGIDVEKIREVNLEKMSKRYKKNFKNLEDFFIFWTTYEALIKLGKPTPYSYSQIFDNQYILSLVSANEIENLAIKKYPA